MFYENETSPVIEAHFYNKTAYRSATLEIAERIRGERTWLCQIPVTGKRDARKVAAQHNAIPWNF